MTAKKGDIRRDRYDAVKIGTVFGKLTLISKVGGTWWLRCTCGNKVSIMRSRVYVDGRASCGHACKNKLEFMDLPAGREGWQQSPSVRQRDGTLWRIFKMLSNCATGEKI